MNIKNFYLNFEKLNEQDKTKFLNFIISKCDYAISYYRKNLGEFYKDDFIQDIYLLILKIIKNKSFNFYKFPTYETYKDSIVNNVFGNIHLLNYYYNKKYKNVQNKEKIVLSKKFYSNFKKYFYQCSFIAYIKKLIKNEWIKYLKKKNQFLSNTIVLTEKVINGISYQDNKIDIINLSSYLSKEEYRLLTLYNTMTQSEIAKELHITQQSISYRLNKIKKKLKIYEKV